jgi:hypothetical protein
MKLSLIRFTKKAFTFLHLHVFFNPFLGIFSNLFYLTKFSSWANKNKKVSFNDFPGKWDYKKRFILYKWVFDNEGLSNAAINYMEFGVADGHSFLWFVQQNTNPQSLFYGFDTFTGLPEDFGVYKKGEFNRNHQVPDIPDSRAKFFPGLFQQTVPRFLTELNGNNRNVIMLDADLYSATLYALTSLATSLKKGDIIFFDEFAVPTHEFKAFYDFTHSYYINLQLIAAASNYYFAAFKVV